MSTAISVDDAEEEVASEVVADFVTISEEDSKLDVEVSSMDLWCEVDGLPQRLRDKLLEFKEDRYVPFVNQGVIQGGGGGV